MSYMLASLEDTKHWLNVSHDGDDSKIEFGIIAASSMVMAYLKASPEDYAGSDLETDSDGVLIGVLPQMTAATKYLAGVMYRDPDGVEMDKWEMGYLPRPVMAMLYALRDPALA